MGTKKIELKKVNVENEELKRGDVMIRMKDIYEKIDFLVGSLSRSDLELLEANFKLISLFVDLQGAKEVNEVSAIGFHIEDEEEDDEEIEEEIICKSEKS